MFSANNKDHEDYMEAHKGEHPFPLDGTNWSRLVQMRLDREFHHRECACDSCRNFLTRLHSEQSPLVHEHAGVARALGYWFMHAPDLKHISPLFHTEETTIERAIKSLPRMAMTAQTVQLEEVERDWLRKRIKAWGPLAGQYWLPDTTEEFEAHPESRRQDQAEMISAVDAKRSIATDKPAAQSAK